VTFWHSLQSWPKKSTKRLECLVTFKYAVLFNIPFKTSTGKPHSISSKLWHSSNMHKHPKLLWHLT
jgi:hypothetical protein